MMENQCAKTPILIWQVIEHLKAETAYCKAALADTEPLQEQLYEEMRGRIQASLGHHNHI